MSRQTALDNELPGMLTIAKGVAEQTFPHTVDACVWADEFNAMLAKRGHQPFDPGLMIGWFANAIMAGYDTATYRKNADQQVPLNSESTATNAPATGQGETPAALAPLEKAIGPLLERGCAFGLWDLEFAHKVRDLAMRSLDPQMVLVPREQFNALMKCVRAEDSCTRHEPMRSRLREFDRAMLAAYKGDK